MRSAHCPATLSVLGCFVLVTSGCASRLEVVVDVYQGALVERLPARVATAQGRARDLYGQIRRSKLEEYDTARTIGKTLFDDNALDAVGSNGKLTESHNAQRLLEFARACQQAAQVAGYDELVKHYFQRRRFRLAEAVSVEESAHHVGVIAESIIDEIEYLRNMKGRSETVAGTVTNLQANSHRLLTKTRQILKSQSHGALLESMAELFPLRGEEFRANTRKAYDRVYWAEINRVPVELPGDATVVIVKDEIGNYQIRQLMLDPTSVLEAVQNLIQQVLIELAQFGIDAA